MHALTDCFCIGCRIESGLDDYLGHLGHFLVVQAGRSKICMCMHTSVERGNIKFERKVSSLHDRHAASYGQLNTEPTIL